MEQIKDFNISKFLRDCEQKTKPVSFEVLFPGMDTIALDLLKKLLCYDPAQRLSAE